MSFPRYPAYKDSGVEWLGEVPAHWIVTPIKRFGRLKGGAGFPHESQGVEGEALDFHKVNALGSADPEGMLLPSENTISMDTAKKLGAYVFPSGTIVFAKVGAALLLGRIRELGSPACIDNNLMGLVVADPVISVRFLRYAMSLVRFDLISNPGAVPSLNEGQIGDFAIVCPPSQEQCAIAGFLDAETRKIDGLVSEQENLIALLKEKRQAVISHAVTKGLNSNIPMKDSGIEWLGEVPAHWDICALNYRYDVALGKMLDEKKISGNHLGPYLRNTDVQWGRINTDDLPKMDFKGEDLVRYSLEKGDLLVCEGGEVGRAAVWEGQLEPCFYQKALHRLRPRNASADSPEFQFFALVVAASLRAFSGSEGKATIAHLPAEAFRRYQFPFPPKSEQVAIAENLKGVADYMDKLVGEAEKGIELLKERRSALISAAVTGKIDVRKFNATEAA